MRKDPEWNTYDWELLRENTKKVVRKQSLEEPYEHGVCEDTECIFGGDDTTNPGAGRLKPAFVPTQYELGVLAEHYYNIANEIDEVGMEAHPISGSQSRLQSFACERINTIRELVGGDAVELALWLTRKKWKKLFEHIETYPCCPQCGDPHRRDEPCHCGS